jgi:hypothetical protein
MTEDVRRDGIQAERRHMNGCVHGAWKGKGEDKREEEVKGRSLGVAAARGSAKGRTV